MRSLRILFCGMTAALWLLPSQTHAAPHTGAFSLPPRVYAVNNHAQKNRWSISIIDPRSNRVTGSIAVAPQPHHIYPVPGTNRAYVSHFVGDRLEIVSLVTNRVVGHVGVGHGPRHLSFSPDGRRAYTDDFWGGTITAIDTATHRPLRSIRVGEYPNYNIVSPDNRFVYVADFGSNTVSVVDARSLRMVASIPVAASPFDVALTPDGRTLIATGSGTDSATIVDTRTRRPLKTIWLGGNAYTFGVEEKLNVRITPDGRFAWIGDEAGSAWAVINIVHRRLQARIPAGSGADIMFMPRAGPARGLGIGTARYARFMTVVRPDKPSKIRTISTAPGSHLLVYSRDWTRAYVSCRPGNAVTVVDLRTLRAVAVIPVGRFPDGMAYIWFVKGQAHWNQ